MLHIACLFVCNTHVCVLLSCISTSTCLCLFRVEHDDKHARPMSLSVSFSVLASAAPSRVTRQDKQIRRWRGPALFRSHDKDSINLVKTWQRHGENYAQIQQGTGSRF